MAWEQWNYSRAHARNRSLTDEQVRQIRRLRAEGLTAEQVANKLGCSKFAVEDISRGRSYRHVD